MVKDMQRRDPVQARVAQTTFPPDDGSHPQYSIT